GVLRSCSVDSHHSVDGKNVIPFEEACHALLKSLCLEDRPDLVSSPGCLKDQMGLFGGGLRVMPLGVESSLIDWIKGAGIIGDLGVDVKRLGGLGARLVADVHELNFRGFPEGHRQAAISRSIINTQKERPHGGFAERESKEVRHRGNNR